MGGHVEYPKPMHSRVYVYNDRIQLENPNLIIPYKTITSIENMDEKKISAKRVVALGLVFAPLAIVGAMWKKNHIYTVIQFKDEVGEKAIVLDFGDKVDDIQGWIYRRMLSSKKPTTIIHPENGFMFYENKQYGFRMKYPQTWIKDEMDQKTEDYSTVVEFCMFIENMPPFVTVYINDLSSRHLSFHDFVNREKEEIKNDSGTSIIELSDLVLANNPPVKLVDVEYEGYKRLVFWISFKDIVYEISYEQAAPIFCAGYTVYSGLRAADPKPHERVAVVGIGGLGHLGIQYSKSAGFHTIALTHSKDKEELAYKLGADQVVNNGKDLKLNGGTDVILVTSNSYKPAIEAFQGLRPEGRWVLMGISNEKLTIDPFSLFFYRHQIIGSQQNSPEYLYEALDYVAKGKVKVMTETFSLDNISEAYDKVANGQVRFRAVIHN